MFKSNKSKIDIASNRKGYLGHAYSVCRCRAFLAKEDLTTHVLILVLMTHKIRGHVGRLEAWEAQVPVS